MQFEIRHKDGSRISISDIDVIAAKFWNVELSKKTYAAPKGKMNWFDVIGYAIASPGNYTSGWRNVICTIQSNLLDGIACTENQGIATEEEMIMVATEAIKYSIPYVELIKHFMELELVPVTIK